MEKGFLKKTRAYMRACLRLPSLLHLEMTVLDAHRSLKVLQPDMPCIFSPYFVEQMFDTAKRRFKINYFSPITRRLIFDTKRSRCHPPITRRRILRSGVDKFLMISSHAESILTLQEVDLLITPSHVDSFLTPKCDE